MAPSSEFGHRRRMRERRQGHRLRRRRGMRRRCRHRQCRRRRRFTRQIGVEKTCDHRERLELAEIGHRDRESVDLRDALPQAHQRDGVEPQLEQIPLRVDLGGVDAGERLAHLAQLVDEAGEARRRLRARYGCAVCDFGHGRLR